MGDAIGWVVRDATGETQVSVRFGLQSQARSFAENCAMPVRVWRVVRKSKPKTPNDVVRDFNALQVRPGHHPPCKAMLDSEAECTCGQ